MRVPAIAIILKTYAGNSASLYTFTPIHGGFAITSNLNSSHAGAGRGISPEFVRRRIFLSLVGSDEVI
jgi:hypothetical protein